MRALIMAGGTGSRLARGEKPLVLINGQPMIQFVINAFMKAGCEPVVIASPNTPMTANWCRAHGHAVLRTPGSSYIEDLTSAAQNLEESRPFLTTVSDIPCITPGIISRVLHHYQQCGKDALSTWIPASMVRSCRESMPYRETIDGIEACPAGVNVLRGDLMGENQEEFFLLLDDPRLAFNVNTFHDLTRAEKFLVSTDDHF